MFSGFFNYDNAVWRFIGKFWDIMLVSWLWVLCSLPVFTIGASTTAMYYVTLKLVRDEDGYTIRSFFKSFKENFKQATILWLILLVAGGLLACDFYFFYRVYTKPGQFRQIMQVVFAVFILIYLFIVTYVFPLQARFYNSVKQTLINAFFISIRHLFHTIGIFAMDIALAALSLYLPLLIFFGVALLAFVNSYVFNAIFKKYMPKEEPAEEELRPLFADEESTEDQGQ
ncbi:MAG: YesL family protein [Lachnospiraceae bacterium]